MRAVHWPNGATANPTTESLTRLKAWGYAIVSRKFRVAARIDRDDWGCLVDGKVQP